MGYPMSWGRVVDRNSLRGNYTKARDCGNTEITYLPDCCSSRLRMISGDLRRVEQDSVDGNYPTKEIADRAGVDIETVQKVLRAFFNAAPTIPPHDV